MSPCPTQNKKKQKKEISVEQRIPSTTPASLAPLPKTILTRAAGAEAHFPSDEVLDQLRPFPPVCLSGACETVSFLKKVKK